MTSIRPRGYLATLRWSTRPLGVDENHWTKSQIFGCETDFSKRHVWVVPYKPQKDPILVKRPQAYFRTFIKFWTISGCLFCIRFDIPAVFIVQRFPYSCRLLTFYWCLHGLLSFPYRKQLISSWCSIAVGLSACVWRAPSYSLGFITSRFALVKVGSWTLPKRWPRIRIRFSLSAELLFIFTV